MSGSVWRTVDIHIQDFLFHLQIEQMSSDVLNQFMRDIFRIEFNHEVKL